MMLKTLILITFLITSSIVYSEDKKPQNIITEFNYDILLDGENSGLMTMSVSQDKNSGYSILTNNNIKLSGWWGKHTFNSSLIEQFSSAGILVKADNIIMDGKKAFWTKMKISNSELWASSVQVKSVTEYEEQEFIGMMADIGSLFIPGVGDVLAVSHLLFAGSGSSHNNVRFSQSSYDTSFNNIAFYWLQNDRNLPDEINILDSDDLSIYHMHTEYHGVTNIQVGPDHLSAHYYALIPKKGEPLYVWLATNQQNVPYIVQLIGEDSDGPFQIKLKKS